MREFCSLIRANVLPQLAGINTSRAQDGLGNAFLCVDAACELSHEVIGPSVVAAGFTNETHPGASTAPLTTTTSFRFCAVRQGVRG